MKTNTEQIIEYMSCDNPLHQAFVITAIEKYVDEVLANEGKIREAAKTHNTYLVNPISWLMCAYDWHKRFDD